MGKKRTKSDDVTAEPVLEPQVITAADVAEIPAEVIAEPVVEPADQTTDIMLPSMKPDGDPISLETLKAFITELGACASHAGWVYINGRDGQYKLGSRYDYRAVTVTRGDDGLTDFRFVGLVIEAGQLVPEQSWQTTYSTKEPSHEPTLVLNEADEAPPALGSTGPQGGISPQCVDSRGATITLFTRGGPVVDIRGGEKVGAFKLTAILDQNGDLIQ